VIRDEAHGTGRPTLNGPVEIEQPSNKGAKGKPGTGNGQKTYRYFAFVLGGNGSANGRPPGRLEIAHARRRLAEDTEPYPLMGHG